MDNMNKDGDELALNPYTVSAVYDDGLEALIRHCMTADAQAARDQVIMDTNGRVIIASVFDGHLSEPDAVIFHANQPDEPDEEEAAGVLM